MGWVLCTHPTDLRYSQELVGKNAERFPDGHSLNVLADYRRQIGRVAGASFLDILNLHNRSNVSDEEFIERTGEVDT